MALGSYYSKHVILYTAAVGRFIVHRSDDQCNAMQLCSTDILLYMRVLKNVPGTVRNFDAEITFQEVTPCELISVLSGLADFKWKK